jgi:hypothetical protein
MAKISAKNAIVIFDGNDLSKDAVSYNVTDSVDSIDVTGFTDGAHNFVPGQLNGNVTIDFLWNSAAGGAYTVLSPLVGTIGKTLSIYPEASGGKRWTGTFFLRNIAPSGSPASEIKMAGCEFVVNSSAAPTWSTSS